MSEELKELLKERLKIEIVISEENYVLDTKRIKVTLLLDGEPIDSDYDTFSVED